MGITREGLICARPLRTPGAIGIGALLMVMQLTACSFGGGNGEWAGTSTDSSGVVIVVNPGQGMWADSEGWTLEEELRIGTFGGDLNYQFGQVGAIALNSGGEILVSDNQAHEVRVFSPAGTYLRTVGRPGSGPGELGLGQLNVLVAPGDTLLVPDQRNRRINRYAPDGTSLGSAPLDSERERALRYNLNSVGDMAVQMRPVQSPNRPAADTFDAIRVIESSGAIGDTLLLFPSGGLFQGAGIHYFTPEPWWDITDSLTVLYGVNSEYRVGSYGRDGSLRRIISMPHEPRLITPRDIRAIFAYLDRAWLDAGVPPSRLPANHAQVHFAEFFPVFSQFHAGRDGSLWVQRVQSPGDLSDEEIERYNFIEDFGSPDWGVFDGEGRFLGVVSMPPRFQPRMFVEDKIYGVWRDDLDVQYVVRLRVVEG